MLMSKWEKLTEYFALQNPKNALISGKLKTSKKVK